MKYLEVCLQTSIFAPLFNRKRISLDYGVMVAQQVLVLFVQVRILVVQLKESLGREIFQGFLFNIIILIDLFLDQRKNLRVFFFKHTTSSVYIKRMPYLLPL